MYVTFIDTQWETKSDQYLYKHTVPTTWQVSKRDYYQTTYENAILCINCDLNWTALTVFHRILLTLRAYIRALHMYIIYIYIHTHTLKHTYIRTYINTNIHTYIRTYIHTHTHKYRHTHAHTHVCIKERQFTAVMLCNGVFLVPLSSQFQIDKWNDL
jgi:hypothetical protein